MNIYNFNRFLILTIINFLAVISLFSQQILTWEKVVNDPFPNSVYLDIQFLESNPNYGWACGFGVIVRTTDGGETWRGFQDPNGLQFESIQFLNENVGYLSAAGTSFLWKSTDGGDTWVALPYGERDDIPYWGLHFYDENNGLVCAGNCASRFSPYQAFPLTVYKTTDGGQTWSQFSRNITDSKLSDPLLLEPNGKALAVSSGYIWESFDGGRNWDELSFTGGNDWHEEITLVNNSILIPYDLTCAGSETKQEGGLRFTDDYGETWKNFSTGNSMYGTFLLSENEGWGVGFKASVYHTTDAGDTWELRNKCIPDDVDLDDIWFINDTTAFIAGDGLWRMKWINEPTFSETLDTLYVCKDSEIVLEGDPGYQNYEWSTGENSSTISLSTDVDIVVKVLQYNDPCTDPIFEKVFNLTVLDTVEYDINVDPSLEFCEDESTVLEVIGVFDIQNWYDPGGNFVSNSSSITANQDGIYSFIAIDSLGCEYNIPFPLTVYPLPDPDITSIGAFNVCIGDTVTLDAGDFASYEWTNIIDPNNVISNDRQIRVTDSGTFNVLVSSDFGCESVSDPFEVIVRPDTNLYDFTINYTGQFTDFEVSSDGKILCGEIEVSNYSTWKTASLDNPELIKNNVFSIPSSQLPIIIPPNETRLLTVCFKADSVGLNQDTIEISDLCFDHYLPLNSIVKAIEYRTQSRCELDISIKQLDNNNEFYVVYSNPYPNPSDVDISIDFIYYIPSGQESLIEAELYDLNGNLLDRFELSENNIENTAQGEIIRGSLNLDISSIDNGAYLIRIKDRINDFTTPIMISK